jgi:hypothetical protein
VVVYLIYQETCQMVPIQSQPAPPNGTVPSGRTFEEQPIPPTGPAIPGGGIFQTPSAAFTEDGTVNPQTGGVFNAQPPSADEGATGVSPPANGGTEAPTLTEKAAPICPEGQVLDEQTGLCVLEELDE